jgi:hypothetical protein
MKTYTKFLLRCPECGYSWTIKLNDPITEQEASENYGMCDECPSVKAEATGIPTYKKTFPWNSR